MVKVPHHGSLTSSSAAFVDALRPTVAIVSVGRSNHFGHPVPAVLERYRSVGAEIFRTDQDGAVTVVTDGTSSAFEPLLGEHCPYPNHEGTKDKKVTRRRCLGGLYAQSTQRLA